MADLEQEDSTKSLTATCYCKSVQYTIKIPTSKLPLPVHLCHCTICRYTHGTLCVFHTRLPDGISPTFIPPSSPAQLTGYKHANAQAERFFCSTCGCHIGDRGINELSDGTTGQNDGWVVATSLFSEHGEDIFPIKTHCFTDGLSGGSGLFSWLPTVGEREVKVWNPDPSSGWGSTGVGRKETPPEQEWDEAGNERLRAECHCGGVSFTIPRPTVPAIQNDPFLSKYISPRDPNRWIACVDPCQDCRLQCGTHVTAWTFVPRAHLLPPIPPGLGPSYGTLKTFVSSPGVLRGFCGTCGATIFYSCEDRTPTPEQQIIDVSVGVLRAPEGILAENWLTWRAGGNRIAKYDSAFKFDSVFTVSLSQGLEKWSIEKYGEAPDFDID